MAPQLINRPQLKAEMRELLSYAQVSPKRMTALYLGLDLVLALIVFFVPATGVFSTFLAVFRLLMSTVLFAGFTLYCMAIRRNERAEYLSLFDGFAFAGKLIALSIVMGALIGLWTLAFIIPGIITFYRYRFALFNLYENPDIGVLQALEMSKRQTLGYKGQLFSFDLSYLGWMLLADLPLLVESTLVSMEQTAAILAGTTPVVSEFAVYSVLPSWGWLLVHGIWLLAVSVFYLPHKTCTELGYFEIAKKTSGVGCTCDVQTDDTDSV